jgi:hypothetical protein
VTHTGTARKGNPDLLPSFRSPRWAGPVVRSNWTFCVATCAAVMASGRALGYLSDRAFRALPGGIYPRAGRGQG